MRPSPLIILVPFVAALSAACAQPGARQAADSTAALSAQASDSYEDRARQVLGDGGAATSSLGLDEDLLYKFLVAEIAGQRGNSQLAAQAYLEMARATRDPRIARRATEIALYAKLDGLALESARIWLSVEGDSPAARHTLASLLVNASDLQAAKPLFAELLAAAPEAEVGPTLLQVQGALSRYPDRKAANTLIQELSGPYVSRPEAHFARAQGAAAAEDYAGALVSIKEALRLKPDWDQAALVQSKLLARDDRAAGLRYLDEFLRTHPNSQEIRLNYARGLIGERRYPEAREQFQKLLEANEANADLAFTVALLSIQINDLESADRQLKQVLSLGYKDPDSVRFQIAQVNEELKRLEEAARWYRSVEGGDQYVASHARYAVILARQSRLEEARAYLRDLKPQNEPQRVQLVQAEAQLLREVRDYQQSYDVLKQALDVQPDHPDLLYDIALAAEKVDRLDVVESSLRKLISMRPEHAQAYNALGYTLADRTDRFAEAKDYIAKALELAPGDPFILDSMGWVQFRMGNIAEGLEYLRRAYEQRPDPEIAAHLGEALWAKGRRDEAQQVWQEALKAHPDSEELQKVIQRFLK
jgi:tetratricopeptide (TPR) repeat protein